MARPAMTQNRQQQRPAAPPPPKETEQAVAVFQAPRLPWHPEIQKRFGIERAEWRALTDAVFPTARTSDAILLALSYCRARRLDVFKRVVHIVPIWDKDKNREVESVWPGVGELRTTAARTGVYAGLDVPEFGPEVTRTFKARVKKYGTNDWEDEEATVTFPEWCRITTYKIVKDQRSPFPGPKVLWTEFYTKKSRYSTLPNDMWTKKASYMLEKCAEAGSLRRAFPDELGDQFSAEEAGFFGAYDARPVDAEVLSTKSTAGASSPAEPRRADFSEGQAEVGSTEVTQGAGEVVEAEDGREEPPPPEGEHDDGEREQQQAVGDGSQQSPKKSWKIAHSIVGQDAKIKAILALLTTPDLTEAEVDDIEKEHAEFIDKLGLAKKSEVKNEFTKAKQAIRQAGAQ